jgi:ABC-type nitrate/sulfonate/bicarbonate transport system substrate-binding protein
MRKKYILTIFTLIIFCFISTIVHAVVEVKIQRQVGQINNMPLLYQAIEIFENKSAKKNIKIKVVLQPLSSISDGVHSMLAGNTDIILGAVVPMILSNDKIPNKLVLLTSTAKIRYFMICANKNIKTEKDLLAANTITIKNLGSSDHLYIRTIAKRITGSYTGLDSKIIIMPYSQSHNVIQSGRKDIDCAINLTPSHRQLIKNGHVHILNQSNADAHYYHHVTFTSKAWAEKNKELVDLWVESVHESIIQMNTDPRPALKKWQLIDGNNDDIEELVESLKSIQINFSSDLEGVRKELNFLQDMDLVKNKSFVIDQLLWKKEQTK